MAVGSDGRADSPRSTFYYYLGDRIEAVRDGPWKLRRAADDGEPQLFHLDDDPSEKHARAERRADIVSKLTEDLEDFDLAARP